MLSLFSCVAIHAYMVINYIAGREQVDFRTGVNLGRRVKSLVHQKWRPQVELEGLLTLFSCYCALNE